MTREEAIAIIRKEYLCVDRDCDIERSCGKCDLVMPDKEPILEAYKMAIKALEQEPKMGHWKVVSDGYGDSAYICECSECKDSVWVYKDADRKWNFCPNCGAKMSEIPTGSERSE